MQSPVFTSQSDLCATAARLVVEEGLDYGAAKQRALKVLGLPRRSALPSNDELEQAVVDYIGLYCADTQPQELHALRELALVWMRRLERFNPYLAGGVWRGSATRNSDIQIDLFCPDPKSAELALVDLRVDYEQRSRRGLHGETVDTLSIHCLCIGLREMVGVHLLVYDLDQLRGALRLDASGRSPRGNLVAVERLLQTE